MKSKWKIANLGEYTSQQSIRNRGLENVEVYSVTNTGGFTKSSDYFNKEVFSKDLSNYKLVKKNQFAYNPSRINVGSIACLTESDFALVSPLYIIFDLDKNSLYHNYLLRYLKSHYGNVQIRNNTQGSVRDSLKYEGLERINIPLPPLEDQILIADILTRAEKLIAKRKESIKALDEFLKSTFLEMFGDPVRNERGWEKKKLDSFDLNLIAGSSYGGEDKEFLDEDELGVIKISAVTWGTFNPKEFKAVKKILINKKTVNPLKGDLLFSRANTRELVGATCIVDMDYLDLFLPDKIWKVNFDTKYLNKKYFHHLMQVQKFKDTLTKDATGSHGSMLNISMDKLRSFSLPVPPIDLQNKFAAIVEKVENIKIKYNESLVEMEKLYGCLSQRAFRGEM